MRNIGKAHIEKTLRFGNYKDFENVLDEVNEEYDCNMRLHIERDGSMILRGDDLITEEMYDILADYFEVTRIDDIFVFNGSVGIVLSE